MADEKNVKLFVVSHKLLNPKYYPDREIIYVGKNKDKFCSITDTRDDRGDNIASKNYTYCECTAIYYIWKNVKCDIVGIEHYRRLFYNFFRLRRKEYFINKLKKYDFIVMREYPFIPTIKKQFIDGHGIDAFNIFKEAIEKEAPDYLEAFNEVMNGHHIAWCNMFVTTKDKFDKYCEFLFKVLSYVENHFEIPKDPYLARLIGFISERLLSIYLKKNKLKVCHSFVFYSKRYKKVK